jgi:hypothetical protein
MYYLGTIKVIRRGLLSNWQMAAQVALIHLRLPYRISVLDLNLNAIGDLLH